MASNSIGSYPKMIYLQLTSSCNLRCKMCYEWGDKGLYKNDENTAIEFDTIKSIVLECADFSPHYFLYGGEPFIYKKIIDVINLMKDNGSRVDINTNGTLLEQYAEAIVDSEVDNLFISIDGPEEINDIQRGKDVFKKSMKGINEIYRYKKAKNKKNPKISINTTITPLNHCYLSELYFNSLDLNKIDQISLEMQTFITDNEFLAYKAFLKNYFNIDDVKYASGFINDPMCFKDINYDYLIAQVNEIKTYCEENKKYININPLKFDHENLPLYFEPKARSQNERRCYYPWLYLEVNSKGLVSPCHAFYDLTFGDIYSQKLMDIWTSDEYKYFRNLVRKKRLDICYGCCLYNYDTKYV